MLTTSRRSRSELARTRSATATLTIDGGGGNKTIYVGGGTETIFAGGYGTSTIIGNPNQQSGTTDVFVGGPDPANPNSPTGAATQAVVTITAGNGDAVLIGGAGQNTFNVAFADYLHPATRVIWGNGGTSTYHFTGAGGVTIAYINPPTVQGLAQLKAADIDAAVGNWPHVAGTAVIVNPGPNDRIYVGGTEVGSASYQVNRTNDKLYRVYTPLFSTEVSGDHVPAVGSSFEGSTVTGVVYEHRQDGAKFVGTSGISYSPSFFTRGSAQPLNSLFVSNDTSSSGVNLLNFVNGNFGINLTGNGPITFDPDKSQPSDTDPANQAANPNFLSFSDKLTLQLKSGQAMAAPFKPEPAAATFSSAVAATSPIQ